VECIFFIFDETGELELSCLLAKTYRFYKAHPRRGRILRFLCAYLTKIPLKTKHAKILFHRGRALRAFC